MNCNLYIMKNCVYQSTDFNFFFFWLETRIHTIHFSKYVTFTRKLVATTFFDWLDKIRVVLYTPNKECIVFNEDNV